MVIADGAPVMGIPAFFKGRLHHFFVHVMSLGLIERFISLVGAIPDVVVRVMEGPFAVIVFFDGDDFFVVITALLAGIFPESHGFKGGVGGDDVVIVRRFLGQFLISFVDTKLNVVLVIIEQVLLAPVVFLDGDGLFKDMVANAAAIDI